MAEIQCLTKIRQGMIEVVKAANNGIGSIGRARRIGHRMEKIAREARDPRNDRERDGAAVRENPASFSNVPTGILLDAESER